MRFQLLLEHIIISYWYLGKEVTHDGEFCVHRLKSLDIRLLQSTVVVLYDNADIRLS